MKLNKKQFLQKKLQYQCQNLGFREIELILIAFANKNLSKLTLQGLEEFAIILQQSDDDLYKWLIRRLPYPTYLSTDIMNLLKK